jgi:hypothetical protein
VQRTSAFNNIRELEISANFGGSPLMSLRPAVLGQCVPLAVVIFNDEPTSLNRGCVSAFNFSDLPLRALLQRAALSTRGFYVPEAGGGRAHPLKRCALRDPAHYVQTIKCMDDRCTGHAFRPSLNHPGRPLVALLVSSNGPVMVSDQALRCLPTHLVSAYGYKIILR